MSGPIQGPPTKHGPPGMQAIAREKLTARNAHFRTGDITGDWDFASGYFDLISFSLVLEHIENLDAVFEKSACLLKAGGLVYIDDPDQRGLPRILAMIFKIR